MLAPDMEMSSRTMKANAVSIRDVNGFLIVKNT